MRGAHVEKGEDEREIVVRWDGGGIGKGRCVSFVVPEDYNGGSVEEGEGIFERWVYALKKASLGRVRIEDVYEIGDKIGKGMNGIVVKGWDKTTKSLVAIKSVNRKRGGGNLDRMLEREVKIVKLTQHDHIVQVVDVFVTTNKVFFVMELVSGGELFDFIAAHNNFDEMHAAMVMRDLLDAVRYLHGMGIVHRDIKLENLLCVSKSWPLRVKLADFGFASFSSSSRRPSLCSFVGTPYYLGPELLNKEGYGPEVDLWACGVVLYIMLSGKFPFAGKSIRDYFEQVIHRQVWFPELEWGDVSSAAKDLVVKLLDKNPRTRLTAEEALNHPWMTMYNRNETRTRPSLVSTVKFRDYKDESKKERQERIFRDSQQAEDAHPPVKKSNSSHKVWKRDSDSLLKRSSGLLNKLKLQKSSSKRHEERRRARENVREPDIITSSFSDDDLDNYQEEDSYFSRKVNRAERIMNGDDRAYSDADESLLDSSRILGKADGGGSQSRFRRTVSNGKGKGVSSGGKVIRSKGTGGYPSPPSISSPYVTGDDIVEPTSGSSRWKLRERDEFDTGVGKVYSKKSKSRVIEDGDSIEASPRSKKSKTRITDDGEPQEATSSRFPSSRFTGSTRDPDSSIFGGRTPRSGLLGRFLSQRRSVEEYKMSRWTRLSPSDSLKNISDARHGRCSLDFPLSTPSSEDQPRVRAQRSTNEPGKVSRKASLFSRFLRNHASFGQKSSASRKNSTKSTPEENYRDPDEERYRSRRRSIDIIKMGMSRRRKDRDTPRRQGRKREHYGSQSRGWLFGKTGKSKPSRSSSANGMSRKGSRSRQ